MSSVLIGLILVLAIAFVVSIPMAWLLMLFLGNIGLKISLWGAYPGGILLFALTQNTKGK